VNIGADANAEVDVLLMKSLVRVNKTMEMWYEEVETMNAIRLSAAAKYFIVHQDSVQHAVPHC
jgi:hypothetical protein